MVNIYNREILFGEECHAKIMEGVNALADAVASTMGPKGKNVVIKLGLHDAKFTKDGVTVARNVFFPDEFKNMGAEIISGVALRTGNRVGDGTTSATVLARAMLTAGSPINMEEIDLIVSAIKSYAVPCITREDKYNVAFISANGDADVANIIADTLETVGLDGSVSIELSSDIGLKSEIVSGMSIDKGYVSPYFVTNTEKMTVELDNPHIMILENPLFTLEQIFETVNGISKRGESLLIIAPEIGGEALSTLILNKVKNNVRVSAIAVKLTDDFMEDIAIATGSVLADKTMGKAYKVIIHHDKTIIVDGHGNAAKIEERCNLLREAKAKDRLARLSGGVAVIKVGGNTEAEASERLDRVDDALNATRSAMEEGIVPGGGSALYWAGKSLPEGAVRTATEAPIRQILKNSGLVADEILAGIHAVNHGYDARNMRHCLMMENGIIDPVKVVCSALRDAASVATLVMNTEAGIVEKTEK